MSADHVETARALVSLWDAGVRDVPTEYFDPEVELVSPLADFYGEPYRGHEGIARWVRDIDEQFLQWQFEIKEARALDDAVLTLGTLRGRGRASEIEMDQAVAIVMQFGDDDRITRLRIYWDLDAARADLGLAAAG
jgi:ketosteroid isomerase-like protein